MIEIFVGLLTLFICSSFEKKPKQKRHDDEIVGIVYDSSKDSPNCWDYDEFKYDSSDHHEMFE